MKRTVVLKRVQETWTWTMHLEMASTKARHHEVTSSEACRGIVKVHCCQEKADRQL